MSKSTKSSTARKSSTPTAKKVGGKKAETTKTRKPRNKKVVDRSNLSAGVQEAIAAINVADKSIAEAVNLLDSNSNGTAVFKSQMKSLSGMLRKLDDLGDKIASAGDRFESKRIRDLAKTDKVAAAKAKKAAKLDKMRASMAALEAELADLG